MNEKCSDLRHPDSWAVGLSIFLLVGILISYLPQHLKLIRHRSSAGLSPFFVLLGALSSIAGFTNILTLPASRHAFSCCSHTSTFPRSSCGASLLGVAQVGTQWFCFMLISILFVVYATPADRSVNPPHQDNDFSTRGSLTEPSQGITKSMAVKVVALPTLFYLTFTGLISGVLLHRYWSYPASDHRLKLINDRALLNWSQTQGLLATILASVQYIPQLYTTFVLGRLESLSALTIAIQVPGAFLFAFSLFLRTGGWEGWSSWLVYAVTGVLQGALGIMAAVFALREWRNNKEEQERDRKRVGGRHDDNEHGRGNYEDDDDNDDNDMGANERDALLYSSVATRHGGISSKDKSTRTRDENSLKSMRNGNRGNQIPKYGTITSD